MQKLKFIISLVGTFTMIYVMAVTGSNLKTPTTPNGILNLEFANTTTKAATVIKAWEDNLLTTAKVNTWWDFVFLFFYSFLLFNICKWIHHLFPSTNYGKLGHTFAKLSIITALLDVVENVYMLKVLRRTYNCIDITIMSTASYIKWLLVVAIIAYCLLGVIKIILQKISSYTTEKNLTINKN
jgi:hypothetical protein